MDYSSVTKEIVDFIEAYAKYTCDEVIAIEPPTLSSGDPSISPVSSEEEDNVSIRYDCSDSSGSLTSDASSLAHFDILELSQDEVINALLDPEQEDYSPIAFQEGLQQLSNQYSDSEIDQLLAQLDENEIDITVDDILIDIQNDCSAFFEGL